MPKLLRVSSHSDTQAVAGAIAGIVHSQGHVELTAIGAPAVENAVVAMVKARTLLRRRGLDLYFVSTFYTTQVCGEDRSALHFAVKAWNNVTDAPQFLTTAAAQQAVEMPHRR